MGWFGESAEERKLRIERERRDADKAARKLRQAKQKKLKAEFQKAVEAEVERYTHEHSSESKQARLAQLHGTSSFLNSALGLEFAAKGYKNPIAQLNSNPPSSEKADKQANDLKAEKISIQALPRLTRPL